MHIWISQYSYLEKKISTLAHSNLALPRSKNVSESQPNFEPVRRRGRLAKTSGSLVLKADTDAETGAGVNYLLKFHDVARPLGASRA